MLLPQLPSAKTLSRSHCCCKQLRFPDREFSEPSPSLGWHGLADLSTDSRRALHKYSLGRASLWVSPAPFAGPLLFTGVLTAPLAAKAHAKCEKERQQAGE